MDRLRNVFESIGFADVETFIASGNVIFRSRSAKPSALEKRIEQQLKKALGFEVSTIIRSTAELADIVALDPFPGSATPASTLYVGLLKSAPDSDTRKRVFTLRTPTDEFRVEGRELYWLCHTKSMDSIVSFARLEKTAMSSATFRNITTLRKLAEKYCD
jgi:uncharacterized protein (DUF1697 family)